MSAETNKALVRRIAEECYNNGNVALVDELFAANYVNHDPSAPQFPDREGRKQAINGLRTGFPDFHVTIEDMIAEGDQVAKRWTARGTQTGEYLGIPPTGKHVTFTGTSIYRIADGKAVECWWNYDTLGMLQQIGVIPVAEQSVGGVG